MQWYEPEEEHVFVDAHRLYLTLEGATAAPRLPAVAQANFPTSHNGEPVDEEAYAWLSREGFLAADAPLQSRIERYRNLIGDGGEKRTELQQNLRKAQLLREKLKQLDRELASGGRLFKSKQTQWKAQGYRDGVANEIEALTARATRAENEVEKAGALLRGVLDEIHRAPELQTAHWYGQRITLVTFNGAFLLNYLKDMNPAHFSGRSLAEILEIGHSLA